jgi:hypothetical protein
MRVDGLCEIERERPASEGGPYNGGPYNGGPKMLA